MEVPQDLLVIGGRHAEMAISFLRYHFLHSNNKNQVNSEINLEKFKYFGYCVVPAGTVDTIIELFTEALIWDYGFLEYTVQSKQLFNGKTISTFLCYEIPRKRYYHACLIVHNNFA